MALTLQHGLTEVIRRRAPLDSSVDQAVIDGLEEGDWLKVLSSTGLHVPVNLFGATDETDRLAMPIIIEPQQPDALAAGQAVAFGYHSGQTDRYAADGFAGHVAGDTPAAPVAGNAYAAGAPLFAAGFSTPGGGSALGTLVYGLVPVDSTVPAQVAATLAYVERLPADNGGLLQYVVF
jgi:hypothetical protein